MIMKCPKCGRRLWFIKSFCPFCETAFTDEGRRYLDAKRAKKGAIPSSSSSHIRSERPESGRQAEPSYSVTDRRRVSVDTGSSGGLTLEQQEALWLSPVALAGLSAGTAAAVTIGSSGLREHDVSPETARWAKPIVDLIQRASTLSRDDRYDEAIELYKQVLQQAPDAAIALMSIGCCYGNMGDKREALDWLQRAANVDPTNERIRRNLEGVKRR